MHMCPHATPTHLSLVPGRLGRPTPSLVIHKGEHTVKAGVLRTKATNRREGRKERDEGEDWEEEAGDALSIHMKLPALSQHTKVWLTDATPPHTPIR